MQNWMLRAFACSNLYSTRSAKTGDRRNTRRAGQIAASAAKSTIVDPARTLIGQDVPSTP